MNPFVSASALCATFLLCSGGLAGQQSETFSGPWFGGAIALGGHLFGCDEGGFTCSEDRERGLGLRLDAGIPVRSGFEMGLSSSIFRRNDSGAARTQTNVSLFLQLGAPTGLFLIGGGGFGRVSKSFSGADPNESWNGLGFEVALGYRLQLGSRTSLSPQLGIATAPYRDGFRSSVILGSVGLRRTM